MAHAGYTYELIPRLIICSIIGRDNLKVKRGRRPSSSTFETMAAAGGNGVMAVPMMPPRQRRGIESTGNMIRIMRIFFAGSDRVYGTAEHAFVATRRDASRQRCG